MSAYSLSELACKVCTELFQEVCFKPKFLNECGRRTCVLVGRGVTGISQKYVLKFFCEPPIEQRVALERLVLSSLSNEKFQTPSLLAETELSESLTKNSFGFQYVQLWDFVEARQDVAVSSELCFQLGRAAAAIHTSNVVGRERRSVIGLRHTMSLNSVDEEFFRKYLPDSEMLSLKKVLECRRFENGGGQRTRSYLLHGDYHIGNIGVTEVNGIAIFDWEHVALGDREVDVAAFLMSVIDLCDWRVLLENFLSGYYTSSTAPSKLNANALQRLYSERALFNMHYFHSSTNKFISPTKSAKIWIDMLAALSAFSFHQETIFELL